MTSDEATTVLQTHRLELVPMRFAIVEAVMLGHRREAEALAGAHMPERWPNLELVERAFPMTLEGIRANPAARLWGARVLIAGGSGSSRRVVGSVVFRAAPDDDGVCEIAYGIEEASQGQGYATEAVGVSVAWALVQPGARVVQASTFAWHRPSLRVLEKVGMTRAGVREHETMGEMVLYERRAGLTFPRDARA
jgi:ribosomal-protein-alanine N-acetyltransferase